MVPGAEGAGGGEPARAAVHRDHQGAGSGVFASHIAAHSTRFWFFVCGWGICPVREGAGVLVLLGVLLPLEPSRCELALTLQRGCASWLVLGC